MRKDWIEIAGRAGYSARALIYISIGFLATLVPLNIEEGKLTDTKGVIQFIQDQPFGYYILIALTVGLVGYSIWRFIQAVFDADEHGRDLKSLAIRAGLFVSAASHSLLAFYLMKIVVSNTKASGGDGKAQTVASIFSYPAGEYIVFGVGVVFFVFGGAQLVKSFKEKYSKRMTFDKNQRLFHFICKFGLVVRGLSFFIMGGFFIAAAFYVDPNEVGGTKKVLEFIQDQPWGGVLLAVFGVGLFCFGLYSGLEAVYRNVEHNGKKPKFDGAFS